MARIDKLNTRTTTPTRWPDLTAALAAFWMPAFWLTAFCIGGEPLEIASLSRTDPVSFEKEILPILQKNCLACHSDSEAQGGLVLESPQTMLKGGDTGAAVIPKQGSASLLLQLASHQEDPVMPPEGNDVAAENLTPLELALLRLWIDQGAQGSGGIDSLSPKQWQPLPPGVHPVQAVTISDDGQLVACSRANQICLYHAPSGQLITQLSDSALDTSQSRGAAHRDLIQSLTFNQDGNLLASGGFREVKIWRRPEDVQLQRIEVNEPIHALAVSPSGQWLALGIGPSQIRLYDLQTGNAGHVLEGHTDTVSSVRFTADGTLVISGSRDQTVRVWNVADGSLMGRLETPSPVNAIEVVGNPASDAQAEAAEPKLVTGHADNTLRIWTMPDATSLQQESPAEALNQLNGHSREVTSLCIDPARANHVYSGSMDGSIRLWNLGNGQAVRQFNHGAPVTSISVSPDGARVASASDNATAKMFRTDNGQMIAEMRGDLRLRLQVTKAEQRLSSVNGRLNVAKRLLDDAEKDLPTKQEAEIKLGEELVKANEEVETKQNAMTTASSDKLAAERAAIEASIAAKKALLEQQQAELLAENAAKAVKTAQEKVNRLQQALAISPDNPQLQELLASAQQEVTEQQQQSDSLAAAILEPTKKAQEMANAANETAGKVNEVQQPYNDAVTELETAQANQNLLAQQHALAAQELKVAQDLVPARKESLSQIEAEKLAADEAVQAAKQALKDSEQAIRSIAFSQDGSLLATAGDFARFHCWDGVTGEALAAFAGHQPSVTAIAFLDEDRMITASQDGMVINWKARPDWTLERTIGSKDDPSLISHRATAVDFNAESSQLLVAGGVPSRNGELLVFDLSNGDLVQRWPEAHEDVIYAAKFSPDGKQIASGAADKYLKTFDCVSGTENRRFEGHTDYVLGVDWKSDGEIIASSSADRTIKFWEAETGDQRATANQQLTKHMTAVAYLGDTQNVVSSSGDRRIRLHDGNNGRTIRTFNETAAWLHCVATTPDGKLVVGGDASGTVTIWDGTNGRVLQTLSPQ